MFVIDWLMKYKLATINVKEFWLFYQYSIVLFPNILVEVSLLVTSYTSQLRFKFQNL